MLEAAIVDAKVGKSSWINIINFHQGGGGRRGGRDSPIACGRTAEATSENSERAHCVKSLFHKRRPSLPNNLSLFFLLLVCQPATSAHRDQNKMKSILRQASRMGWPANQGE